MKSPLNTAIAITAGLIVLMGYMIGNPILQLVRWYMLDWAMILAGVATLIGILGLIRIHVCKTRSKDLYSIILVIAFVATLTAGLILGPSHQQFANIVTHVQYPVEASLLALLTFSLIYAAIRLFTQKKGLMGIIFIISAVLFLAISSTFLLSNLQIPALQVVLSAIQSLPLAGARGLILGIALGGLAAGIRVLLGLDRPYHG